MPRKHCEICDEPLPFNRQKQDICPQCAENYPPDHDDYHWSAPDEVE